MRKRIISILLIVVANIMILSGCAQKLTKEEIIQHLNNNSLPVEYVYVTYIYDMEENLHLSVGDSDYVFVGEVIDYVDTKYDSPDEVPRTIYKVNVIENIKGELIQDRSIEVLKTGGINEKHKKFIVYELDYLPKINKYYIFTVFALPDGNILASGWNKSIELPGKENYQESEEYKKIIQAYQNQEESIFFKDKERHKSKYDKNYNS